MIGGESTTRALSERFYDLMESREESADLLALHKQPMPSTRQKFFEFMSGWLGGPQLFAEKYGHPRLRARHLHVAIDDQMIEQWLHCMYQALQDTVENEEARNMIWSNLVPLARHMKNTQPA